MNTKLWEQKDYETTTVSTMQGVKKELFKFMHYGMSMNDLFIQMIKHCKATNFKAQSVIDGEENNEENNEENTKEE